MQLNKALSRGLGAWGEAFYFSRASCRHPWGPGSRLKLGLFSQRAQGLLYLCGGHHGSSLTHFVAVSWQQKDTMWPHFEVFKEVCQSDWLHLLSHSWVSWRGCWGVHGPAEVSAQRPSCKGAHSLCVHGFRLVTDRGQGKWAGVRIQSSSCLWLQIVHLKLIPHLPNVGKHATDPGNRFPQSPGYASPSSASRCK